MSVGANTHAAVRIENDTQQQQPVRNDGEVIIRSQDGRIINQNTDQYNRGVNVGTQKLESQESKKKVKRPHWAPKQESAEEEYPLGKVQVFISVNKFSGYIASNMKLLHDTPGLKSEFYLQSTPGGIKERMKLLSKGFDKIGNELRIKIDVGNRVARKNEIRRRPTVIYTSPDGKVQKYKNFGVAMSAFQQMGIQ